MATPQVSAAAVILYTYAASKGVDTSMNSDLPKAVRTAIQRSAKQFSSPADSRKLPGGILDVAAAVKALDIDGLLNAQKQKAAAKASVGLSVALFVVGFFTGVVVVAVAVFVRLRYRRP